MGCLLIQLRQAEAKNISLMLSRKPPWYRQETSHRKLLKAEILQGQGTMVAALSETEEALAIAPDFEQAQTFLTQLQRQTSPPTQLP